MDQSEEVNWQKHKRRNKQQVCMDIFDNMARLVQKKFFTNWKYRRLNEGKRTAPRTDWRISPITLDTYKMTNEEKDNWQERDTFKLIKKYLLEFDVLKASEQEARNLVAWLQEEIKIREKELPDTPN